MMDILLGCFILAGYMMIIGGTVECVSEEIHRAVQRAKCRRQQDPKTGRFR